MVYVGGVQKVWLKKYRLAEQLVSRVSRGKALPARYSRDTVVSTWHDSSHSSMCLAHVSLRGKLGRDIPARYPREFFTSSNAWVFNTLSLTHPLHQVPQQIQGFKRLNMITIKFGTEYKPTKHSCKLQLYNLPLWLFRDKTLKQTLDLNVSLGTKAKLTHT